MIKSEIPTEREFLEGLHPDDPRNPEAVPIEDNELREQLQAELDEFVLFTDNTPDSNEPTELSVYLRQCGFDNVMNRLCDELMPVINTHTTRKAREIAEYAIGDDEEIPYKKTEGNYWRQRMNQDVAAFDQIRSGQRKRLERALNQPKPTKESV